MINQSDQASNQYGFYAVPKALEPKKKYRQTYDEEEKYSDQQIEEDENQFESLQRQAENEKQLQRDFYVDEAPYPQFKPKQRGLDYGIQIDKRDLFDFDLEVQPLIEILVGRSVVSAINELQQQKEIRDRREFLDNYQKKRNAELMQTQRLEIKHNRKQDEAKRRVLQKETYVKNKKIATKKLIARRDAKHQLLNLRNQVLNSLEQEGFLRQQVYLGLRVQYQSWLYEQIKGIVNQYKKIQETTENLIKQKQVDLKSEHQKHIDKENKRRKDILDERQRIRKENEERRLKKKIRKQRLALNAERAVKYDLANQLVNKAESVDKILKAQSLSNGLTKKKNNPTTVHITGGLLNYLIAIINNSGANYSPQQIQGFLEKVLTQLSAKLQIQISATHFHQVQQFRKKLEDNPIQFMSNKEKEINQLIQKISLEVSVLQSAGISIKSELHNNILNALMSIYLNSLPAPKMEGEQVVASYQHSEKDKKRQELKAKIDISSTETPALNIMKSVQSVVRVRFESIKQLESQQDSKNAQEEKPVNLDEWIDIYDGEGWKRESNERKEAPRQNQHASSYSLTGFENTLIIDERNLYYLQLELEKLLGIQGGEQMVKYRDRLQNLLNSGDKIPIYDIQMKTQ